LVWIEWYWFIPGVELLFWSFTYLEAASMSDESSSHCHEDLVDDGEDSNDVDSAEDKCEVEHGQTDPDLFPDEVGDTVQSTPRENLSKVVSRCVKIPININCMRQMFLEKK
jgi:hypothetical protein